MIQHRVGLVIHGARALVLDVDIKLVNICQAERTKTLHSLVQQCSIPPYSCTQCSDHLRDGTNHLYLCEAVQQLFRLLQYEFNNVTAMCPSSNICQAERTKTLHSLVQQCSIPPYSCTQCSDHLQDGTNHLYPCEAVQQLFRLLQYEFDNVTAMCPSRIAGSL